VATVGAGEVRGVIAEREPTILRPSMPGLVGISTADLLAEPDEAVPFHTPDLIPAEGLVVVAAPPKVGKTILMSQLALVTGCEDGAPRPLFLGREVMPGRVLYVLEEGSRASLRYRVRRQMEGLAIGRSAVTWALQAHVRLTTRRASRISGHGSATSPRRWSSSTP
jgi:hypothetical protein